MAGLSRRIELGPGSAQCGGAWRTRLAPLAGIALATALLHLALIDALMSPAMALQAPRAERSPSDAPRPGTVLTRRMEPPTVRAEPAVEVETAPSSEVPAAPRRPSVVTAARPHSLAKPIAKVARAMAARPVEPAPTGEGLVMHASYEHETTDDTVQALPAPHLVAAAASAGEAAADAAGEPPPVYPTRLPGAFRFVYDMSRGMISGRGELALRLTPDGYEAKLEGSVAGFSILDWTSRGGFDAAGFAPLRFVDQRRGRGAQAANFQRAEGRILYSGTKREAPLPPGAQDRLSWMLQLAAIARARPQRLVEGARITLFVSGARGDADAWTFQVGAPVRLDTPAGTVQAVPLLREPRKEYDTRAEVWLDPAREYLPAKARLQSSREGGDALELLLQEVQAPP
jgi:hypothetical protein